MDKLVKEVGNHLIRIDKTLKRVKFITANKQNKRGYLAKQNAMNLYQKKVSQGQITYEPNEPSVMDAYFGDDCDYGMTQVVQFKNGAVWSSQFYSKAEAGAMYEYLQDKPDVYVTPFKYQFDTNGKIARKANQMSQVTALVLDIDTYKSELLDDEAGVTLSNINDNLLEDIDGLVDSGLMPAYNYANVSHGVQLVYVLKGGMAANSFPYLQELQGYLYQMLKKYGADSATNDAARLTRAPYSINMKTGKPIPVKTITGSLDYLAWNGKGGYNDWRIRLSKLFNPAKQHANLDERVRHYKTTMAKFSVNKYVLTDLRLLFSNRDSNFGYRHNGLYDYAYRLSLYKSSASLNSIYLMVKNEFLSYVSGLDSRDIERTITDAYHDADNFIKYYVKNGNTVIIKANDGIKKPRKIKNMLERYNVTEHEMRDFGLRSLCSSQIKREHHREIDKLSHRKAKGEIVYRHGKPCFKLGASQSDRIAKQKKTESMRIATVKGAIDFKPKHITVKDMLKRLGLVINLGSSSLKKLKQKALKSEYRRIKAISRGKALRLIYHELLQHRDALAYVKELFAGLNQVNTVQELSEMVQIINGFMLEFLVKNNVDSRLIEQIRRINGPNLIH